MDTCKNCGKPLENPDQELCPACRAVENAKARTRREEKAGHARRRRMNRTTRKMLIAVCVLAVVFTGLCVTATVMYDKYNPDEFIASVDAALEAGDARALKNLLKGEDLTVSDEGAAALCRAFTDAAQREALRGQLEDQVVDGGAQGAFSALGVEKESVFFGYSRYSLTVHSVRLLLSSPVQNLRLSLDGVPRTGEQTADGILYQNLFPGLYTCTVTGTTAAGQAVEGDATDLALLSSVEPTVFSGALPIADITVSGCVNDGAVITVDGAAVEQKPVNGVVTLPQVAVGSTIGMQYTAPWGAVTTASVQFADKTVTALAFENPVTEGGGAEHAAHRPLCRISGCAEQSGHSADLRLHRGIQSRARTGRCLRHTQGQPVCDGYRRVQSRRHQEYRGGRHCARIVLCEADIHVFRPGIPRGDAGHGIPCVHVHLGRRLESERLGGLHGRSLQCRLDGCAALKIINRRIRHEALVQTTHVFMVRQL